MNPDYEKQLEARVREELDTLGDLTAPPALSQRIMERLTTQPAAPWYRRAWPTWPVGWQMASLLVLIAACGGLSLGGWELLRVINAQEATRTGLAEAQALWRTAGVLLNIGGTFLNRLSPTVLITGFALFFTASALCLGLGSACVRLALRPAANKF